MPGSPADSSTPEMHLGVRGDGVGVLWDENRCPRLPVGVAPAGISLNHPGVHPGVWPQILRGTHPADWIFCQVLRSLPHLTYHCSQKGSLARVTFQGQAA